MSVISQLLPNRFWQNFKRRFLGSSWIDSKCQSDICPGNICPCNICPYQDYISCYWLDCDQTSKVGSLDHLWQMPAVIVTFVQATFVLATFVHECLSCYWSKQGQGKVKSVKAKSRQGEGKVRARSRQGKIKVKVGSKERSRRGQGEVKARSR